MIPITGEEKEKLEKECEEKFGKTWSQIKNVVDDGQLAMEAMRARYASAPVTGEAFFGGPIETKMILDYTGLRGSGSNMYYSVVYQLPKWHFVVKKVTEAIAVTPTFADYYNITVAQKQKLEASIRQGLASAMQAVTDYELLSHDTRRYKEILDYFVEADKGTKAGKDDHVLRSLFVDRVDAYTGEGFSLVTMAKRWPTIITDFIRMKTEWTDPEKVAPDKQIPEIMKGLEVSQAEATVLKTKNKLFMEWKLLIFPTIKDRYARLKTIADARKASIDEYRNWLKPYLSTFKSMRELNENDLTYYARNPYVAAGFGQSQSFATMTLWCWKPFTPPEAGKPPAETMPDKKNIRSEFMIDPYDNFVKKWQKVIEYKYGMTFEEATKDKLSEVDKIILKALKSGPGKTEAGETAFRENPEMSTYTLYYAFLDMYLELNLSKTPPPQGVELDNLVWQPIRAFYMSQNVLLLHLMELHARDHMLIHEINRLIGSKEIEEEHAREVEGWFKEKEKEKKKLREQVSSSLHSGYGRFSGPFSSRSKYFIKKGPYEPVFYERGSKMYSRAVGPAYGQVLEFIKSKMHVG